VNIIDIEQKPLHLDT